MRQIERKRFRRRLCEVLFIAILIGLLSHSVQGVGVSTGGMEPLGRCLPGNPLPSYCGVISNPGMGGLGRGPYGTPIAWPYPVGRPQFGYPGVIRRVPAYPFPIPGSQPAMVRCTLTPPGRIVCVRRVPPQWAAVAARPVPSYQNPWGAAVSGTLGR